MWDIFDKAAHQSSLFLGEILSSEATRTEVSVRTGGTFFEKNIEMLMKSGRSRQLYLSDWRNETRYHWVRDEMLRWDKLYEKIRSAGKRVSFIYVLCQNFSVWAKWMSKERIRKETASRCRPPRYSEMHIYDKGHIFCLGEGPF